MCLLKALDLVVRKRRRVRRAPQQDEGVGLEVYPRVSFWSRVCASIHDVPSGS